MIPVPKNKLPADNSNYRPAALTSNVMKALERLVLSYLTPRRRTISVCIADNHRVL